VATVTPSYDTDPGYVHQYSIRVPISEKKKKKVLNGGYTSVPRDLVASDRLSPAQGEPSEDE
jgi:hypothetical protein